MTRYDPFAYGEVHLDPNQQKGAPPQDADDLLFAEGEQVKQAPPADASWELLNEDVEDLLPGAAPVAPVASEPSAAQAVEFGAEILGEEASSELAANEYVTESLAEALPGSGPVGSQPANSQVSPPGLPSVEPAAALDAAPLSSKATPSRGAAQAAASGGAGMRAAPMPPAPRPTRARRKTNVPVRRRGRLLAGAVPLLLCAAGGTSASWFWVIQGNPVMAGILGATTLVGALFAWLFLRG